MLPSHACVGTCVGSARCLTSLHISFSPFPSKQNLLSSENILETTAAAHPAAPGSPAPLPTHTLRCTRTPHPSRQFCRSVKQPEKPSRFVILTRDGCSAQAKSRLLSMAACKLCGAGVSPWVSFQRDPLSQRVLDISEPVFETICLPATCDSCCSNRVQDR